ncbi:MAG TPA: trypsin-like peptidase domain-containing protein [Bryobacteraceae bacterium]|nr:trypsin-like peptidase domain-containing protein [Bryobacteraceae bacterium]
MVRRIPLFCAFLGSIAAPVLLASRLNPAEKRAMELNPAVVLVQVKYSVNGQFQVGGDIVSFPATPVGGSGSGFIYRPDGYIITNGHVVSDAQVKDVAAQDALKQYIRSAVLRGIVLPEYRRRNQPAPTGSIQDMINAVHLQAFYTKPILTVTLANGAEYVADTKQYSDPIDRGGKDVAVIKINASNLPTVTLGDSNNVHIQERVTVIGYPGAASSEDLNVLSAASNLIPTVTNGQVSAVKSMVGQEAVIQSDAVIGHGNSGGPAFNDTNQVIGIATFKSASEAGYNFFVPINTAMEFVNATGTKQESGLFNQLWATALDSYDVGKCQTAKKQLQSVLNIMPNEPDALRLMAASETCIAQEGVVGRIMETSSWMVYSAAGVIVFAVAFLLLARKRPPAAVAVGAAQVAAAHGGGSAGFTRQESLPAGSAVPLAAERTFGSLQVTAGALSGKRFPISKAGVLIGTDPSKCQIVVNEDTISREHAWIVPVENSVVVIDRGSTNGTYINSVDSPRVSKVGLQNGDRVYLGKKGAVVLTYFSS